MKKESAARDSARLQRGAAKILEGDEQDYNRRLAELRRQQGEIAAMPVMRHKPSEDDLEASGNAKLADLHHEERLAASSHSPEEYFMLIHTPIPIPEAMKMPAAKAAVDKEWEKLINEGAWELDTVRGKSEVSLEEKPVGMLRASDP